MPPKQDPETSSLPGPPKQDPETLVLRGRPNPVVRFRRGLIIGMAALASVGLVGVAWLAFEPASFRSVARPEDGEPQSRPTPDALANAPASYGDVPRLGPPLPGDLGRPILERQREREANMNPPATDPAIAGMERAQAAADAERQRIAAAREAARASSVIVQLSGRQENIREHGAEPPKGLQDDAATQARSMSAGQGSRDAASQASAGDRGDNELTDAPSRWTLVAGTIISASLITGLNSDLPGMVLAQVTEPVRDSATGRSVLIPQGSRLIGSYDSVVAYGQRRALLVWQRIVLPDGSSIRLDNMPATDEAGYAGVEDRVDVHGWRLLKGVALSTLLGVGTELSLGSGESDLVRAIRESTQQNAARAGDQITRRNLEVKPTLRVRPGWPLRAIIHKDLVLKPWSK